MVQHTVEVRGQRVEAGSPSTMSVLESKLQLSGSGVRNFTHCATSLAPDWFVCLFVCLFFTRYLDKLSRLALKSWI